MKNAFVKCTRNVERGGGRGSREVWVGGVAEQRHNATQACPTAPVAVKCPCLPACLPVCPCPKQTVICMRPCLFSDSISTSNAMNDFKQFSVSRACLSNGSNESQLHCTK